MDSFSTRRSVSALICLLLGVILHFTPFVASAQTTGHQREARARAEAQDDVLVTEVHIALIRNVLKLTPSQEPYWFPVEMALRQLAQLQAAKAVGTVARTSTRVNANTVMWRLKRIAAIAAPLLKTLDENQKRDLAILAQLAGLKQLLASR